MLPSGTTSRLERKAEATTFQIDDMLTDLREGRLRMPHFQRGMKWQDKDRLDLFDSIYRGFPIGTLLFWKQPVKADTVKFDDLTLEVAKREDGLLIVDGQQRVTTLASALLVARAPGERTILFDLATESFRYGRIQDAGPALIPGLTPAPTQVPVHELLDSSRLIQWIARRVSELPAPFVRSALDCGKNLREFRVPVYVIDTKDEDVLRTIFDRINRTGRRLDDADVFTALFATIQPNDESIELSLNRVARRVAQLGFGTLGVDVVLKALRAVNHLPLDQDFTTSLKRAEVPGALSKTEAALTRVVHFLREDAHIPHAALCPYELPIVVLARFFDGFPEPRQRNHILLRRWLWRGSLAGSLRGAPVSLRQHVDVVGDDESASVQRLLRLAVPGSLSTEPSFEPFSLATAKTKLAVCALAGLSPRDLRTAEPIDLAAMFDEPSPSLPIIVKRSGDGPWTSVANRLLHPPLAAGEIVKAIVRATPEVRASHAIPPEAVAALGRKDMDDFLERRRRLLAELLSAHFRKEAEIGADDSPPLDDILVEEAS